MNGISFANANIYYVLNLRITLVLSLVGHRNGFHGRNNVPRFYKQRRKLYELLGLELLCSSRESLVYLRLLSLRRSNSFTSLEILNNRPNLFFIFLLCFCKRMLLRRQFKYGRIQQETGKNFEAFRTLNICIYLSKIMYLSTIC